MQAARDRDAKFARIILRLLSNEGEMSRKQIVTATGLSDDVAKVILRQLREAVMIDCRGIGNQRKWVKV
jgi:predicted transcriptional regulator